MQCGRGVWAVKFICWRCLYLEFSSFLAVKVSRAAVWGENEMHTSVFEELSYKEVHPCIALFDLQLIGLNKKLTVQIGQDKTLLISGLVSGSSLAIFGVSQGPASSGCVLFVYGSLKRLQRRTSPPCSDQEPQCSIAEPASSHALQGGLLADSEE